MYNQNQIKFLKWKLVHFKWLNTKCVWNFRKQEWDKAICITPKTRKDFTWDIKDMYPAAKIDTEYFRHIT